ncbi:MAG: DUF6624 domain-containing protein [Thermonemataceae bacterium]
MALKNADLSLRNELIKKGQLGEGYNEAMAQLHNHNAEVLNEIIDDIGYPTSEKVGAEASEAAWLVIQHAIGKPSFMKKCAALLESLVSEYKIDLRPLVYLTDRIAVFEGKPQLYGTQFDWDENGLLSPSLFDDLTKVNQRRKALGFNTLEEQTQLMRKQVESENQKPPADFKERKQAFDEWRKKVGWIK